MIGLIAGLLGVFMSARRPAGAAARCRRCWAGFVVGAIIGVAIDVVVQTGIYAIMGHLTAVVGAVVALRGFRTTEAA